MLEVNKDTFQDEVLGAEGLVLVDYWSPSCEPCKALMPAIVELSEKFSGKVKFCKLDTSKARRLAIGQKVLGLPTVALYKAGEKIQELTKDDATADAVEAMLNSHV